MGDGPSTGLAAGRGVFCNRTLNLRSIKVIGYDMDYTLVDYHVEEWERCVYERVRTKFLERGWPVADLSFDSAMVIRGLVVDAERGNLVKANRFGFVKKATHGTRDLGFDEMREAYAREIVDLSDRRWVFLNTLFSLSEACLFVQLVDLLDAGKLSAVGRPLNYRDLYEEVRRGIDATHMEGELKAEVMSDPARFVKRDPEVALTLLDQRHAGKKLMLITNSEWSYTSAMMTYAIDPYVRELLPGQTWRDLFDVVVVGARKPDFFTTRSPFFEVVSEDGLLRPVVEALRPGVAYFGGSALAVESFLGLSGDDILYVGDHMWGDVHVSKSTLRWRTALVLRELEAEVDALVGFHQTELVLQGKMEEKEALEAELSRARLSLQRLVHGYGPPVDGSKDAWHRQIHALRTRLVALDAEVAPLARAASELNNPRWGLLTRAGNDKSHLARQVERYADLYTSRVSNFLHVTPYEYLRSPRGSLPHDPGTPPAPPLQPALRT